MRLQADGGFAAEGMRREAAELGAGEGVLPVTPPLKRVPLGGRAGGVYKSIGRLGVGF